MVPAGQAPVTVCVCVDYSNSMAKAGKIEGAKRATLAMLDLLRDHTDHLGLFFFNIRPLSLHRSEVDATPDANPFPRVRVGSLHRAYLAA